ncbi:MAG: hypothetical protein ACK5ZX_02100 [Bacteroidota bacterium]
MQRSNETKAKAFRIEFFLLFLFFLIGGAGFFLSLTSLDDSQPIVNEIEAFTLEKEPYLSRHEKIQANEWITFDIYDYLITSDTEIITSTRAKIKKYNNRMIGILFSAEGDYEIIFRSKTDKKIIFRELISF